MTTTNLITIVIAIAAIVWLSYRQTTWQPVSPGRAWRMPLILTGVGAIGLFTSHQQQPLEGVNLGLLIVELVIGAAVGAAIGVIAHLRPVTAEALRKHSEGRRADREAPVFEARNGVWGLVLWILLLAARVGLIFWVASLGVAVESSSAAIIMLLGVNRLARTAVILSRAGRQGFVPAR